MNRVNLSDVISIHRIGGGQYEDSQLVKIKDFEIEDILNYLSSNPYDTNTDNVEFYHIKFTNEEKIILAIIDPLELWENERVISEKLIPKEVTLDKYEKIY